MLKLCQRCGEEFEGQARRTLCDRCRREYTLEHQREYQRRYRAANPEKSREINRRCRLKKLREALQ